MEMGVPSVWPSNVPERIWQVSLSLRGVTILLWPGRRRSRSTCTSASVRGVRGGQPSTTTPTPPPWDSPQVVMRKRWPKVFGMEGGAYLFLDGINRINGIDAVKDLQVLGIIVKTAGEAHLGGMFRR